MPDLKHATSIPWKTKVRGPRYGTDHSYALAAEWLFPCQTVADWGGARGYFKKFLTLDTSYILVDGTHQPDTVVAPVVADLAQYREPSEGILLRHVLEMTHDWLRVLENAVAAFTHRMVVITFTPDVPETHWADNHLTWPVYHFNHERDLIPFMDPYLRTIDHVQQKRWLPERVYYLEKGSRP